MNGVRFLSFILDDKQLSQDHLLNNVFPLQFERLHLAKLNSHIKINLFLDSPFFSIDVSIFSSNSLL